MPASSTLLNLLPCTSNPDGGRNEKGIEMLVAEPPIAERIEEAWRSPPVLDGLALALIDRIECGILACGPQGELHHANLAGQRELEQGRPLRSVGGRVHCDHPSSLVWMACLREASTRHRNRLEYVGVGDGRLMVTFMPAHVAGFDAPVVIVMLGRRRLCSNTGLEMLASTHGLTFAERRVFRALVDNQRPRDIAASHGVAIATVRSQIRALRDKLGVGSIDALLLRVAEVPPVSARL